MYEDFFAQRLKKLREQKNISAREMSIALGQNDSYINRLENQKGFPSMEVFLCICKYFKLTPAEFWDTEYALPQQVNNLMDNLKKLNEEQLSHIEWIVQDILQGVTKEECSPSEVSQPSTE